MSKDRRLGRGLAALLGTPADESGGESPTIPLPSVEGSAESTAAHAETTPESEPAAVREQVSPERDIVRLNVYEIDDNPFQPRRVFGEAELASLSECLKDHDMLQPILVRVVDGRYQLISGERRLRAAIQAGWSTVPARVREADDRLAAELAIVENVQRKDLNPLEKALSFRRYLDEHQCTQDDLARRLKIDRSTIANLLRLLELPETVRQALSEAKITAGHARALLPLGEEDVQQELCAEIQKSDLSVRDVERRVAERQASPPKANKPSRATAKSNQVEALERELRTALGTKVEIRQRGKGRGQLVIQFTSHAEFERLRNLLAEPTPNRQAHAG